MDAGRATKGRCRVYLVLGTRVLGFLGNATSSDWALALLAKRRSRTSPTSSALDLKETTFAGYAGGCVVLHRVNENHFVKGLFSFETWMFCRSVGGHSATGRTAEHVGDVRGLFANKAKAQSEDVRLVALCPSTLRQSIHVSNEKSPLTKWFSLTQ